MGSRLRLNCESSLAHSRGINSGANSLSNRQAYFLEYLGATLGFPSLVPTLNLKLKYGEWDEGELLQELIGGRDVEVMWQEYKALHNGTTASNPIPTHRVV